MIQTQLRLLLVTIALGFISNVSAQETLQLIDGGCLYDGAKPPQAAVAFASDNEARNWVTKICRQVGLEPNFQIMAADIDNAMATMSRDGTGRRLVLYNQIFMEKMDKGGGSKWPSVTILAHEIGHHLQNHILERSNDSQKNELQADKFSGFVCAKLGASMEEAISAMNQMPEQASTTHPGRKTRLAAIANGWKEAKTLTEEIEKASEQPAPKAPTPQEPLKQKPPIAEVPPVTPDGNPQPPQPKLVSRLTFFQNPTPHYLTSNGTIVALDARTNQLVIYGWQRPPRFAAFAWSIQAPNGTYDVDRNGAIMMPNQFNQPVQVGIVTNQ